MGKNILMVLEGEFPPDDRVFKEAKLLTQNNYQVDIACFTFNSEVKNEQLEGINIIRKKISSFVYKSSVGALSYPFYFNFWRSYLKEVMSNKQYDIIHIHDLQLAKIGIELKKTFKTKLIIDLHENWPAHLSNAAHTNTFLGKLFFNEEKWRRYEKEMLYFADSVITVVEEMKQRISKLGIQSEKIFVVQNTICIDEYKFIKTEQKKAEQFTLFFAGQINIERGLQIAIPALSKLKHTIPNIKLLIVGNGSYVETLKQIIKEYSVENYVEFLGWKPIKEVLELTMQSDVAIIPHKKWEQTDCSSPNKLFQYMYSGVPLLVSNCDSIQRIIKEANCGEVFIHDDEDSFVEQINKLYQNPKRIEQGNNGRRCVEKKYNWSNTSTELIKMYSNL